MPHHEGSGVVFTRLDITPRWHYYGFCEARSVDCRLTTEHSRKVFTPRSDIIGKPVKVRCGPATVWVSLDSRYH